MRVIFLLFLMFSLGCEKIEKIFLEEDILDRPPSKRCSECHTKIYSQWKDSRHSVAWISEDFIKKTENRTKTKCLSCHAPLEVKAVKKPELRNKLREEGVNCFSCHYRGDTNSIHGPYRVFSPPHYSTYDPDYISSKICAGCHEKTYLKWKESGSVKNCQDCHMPAKKERLIQKFPFTYFHSKKNLHNHSFPSLKADEKDFLINFSIKQNFILMKIKNIKIPHTIPTSQQGSPKYYITITGYKHNKKILEERFMLTPKNGLEPKKWKSFDLFVDDKPNKISIKIDRKLSWSKKKEEILKKDFYFD